ncbi:MAG: hypothetical protein AABX34_06065 [Nanoarchaeota archaeon]
MPKFIFSNIIGSFVFNENYKIIDEILFKDIEQYSNKSVYEEKLKEKHKDAAIPDEDSLKHILLAFKDKKYFSDFSIRNIKITKKSLKESVKSDLLIIQAISAIGDIDKTVNLLVKRLREWYSCYNPEASYAFGEHEKFVALIIKKTKSQLLKDLNVNEKDAIGADMEEKDVSAIMLLASQLNNFYKLRKHYEDYLKELEKGACPNFMEVGGVTIAAKLIAHAGSMKRLVQMPASTIQILGAEKALFRHMRNKKRNLPPKYGLIHEHQLIQKSEKGMQAKAARALADKLSIAVKVDYFKGKFIGDKLKKGLVEKFKIQY